jgi:hypothetical protein
LKVTLVIVQDLLPIVEAIGQDLASVVSIDPKKAEKQSATYGCGSPILGRRRLQSIELLSIVMELKEPQIDEALARTSIAQNVVKLYYQFPWHNVLHNALTKLIKSVLNYTEYPLFEAEVCQSSLVPQRPHKTHRADHRSFKRKLVDHEDWRVCSQMFSGLQISLHRADPNHQAVDQA